MVKIKVQAQIVNRGGKRYIAKDGIIEVSNEDMINFDGFKKVETKKIVTKKTTNESYKKRD